MPAFNFVLGGRYRLLGPLGEGGMASVYRARDLRLNRDVAVKILHDDLTRDPGFLSRFEREAQVVAGLAHPNIVPVYDVGDEGGSRFIIMEYVRGRTLKETIETNGPLPAERALAILLPVLDALGYAHKQGLIHRDIKPHNILLTVDGTPRLADFGIVHLVDGSTTRTAAILGSAHYLSPEQSRGEEATEQSDIYACGVVLYEMLAGHPPFDGPNALAVANQHLNAPLPEIPEDRGSAAHSLRYVLDRALAKDPAERYEDTAKMADALRDWVQNAQGETTALQRYPTALQEVVGPVSQTSLPVAQRAGARPVVAASPDVVLRRSARKTLASAVLTGAALLLLAEAARYSVDGYTVPSYPSLPYTTVPAVWAILLVLAWLKTRAWRYTMDDDAAVVQWGMLSHHRFGVPIRNITTLELKQSVIDRLLGIGTVELCARDQDGMERRVVMENLPHPRQTYEELMRHLGRAARRDRSG